MQMTFHSVIDRVLVKPDRGIEVLWLDGSVDEYAIPRYTPKGGIEACMSFWHCKSNYIYNAQKKDHRKIFCNRACNYNLNMLKYEV